MDGRDGVTMERLARGVGRAIGLALMIGWALVGFLNPGGEVGRVVLIWGFGAAVIGWFAGDVIIRALAEGAINPLNVFPPPGMSRETDRSQFWFWVVMLGAVAVAALAVSCLMLTQAAAMLLARG